MLAVLQEGAGCVDKQARLALGNGYLIEVDSAGGVDRSPSVAKRDRDVDPVQRDVRWPEGCPPQVSVCADATTRVLGFVQQPVGGMSVVALGGRDGPTQQQ